MAENAAPGVLAMPVHDWSKVEAGTFHSFHNAWITHLMGKFNGGLLPEGYYALSEQYSAGPIPDVLTLHLPEMSPGPDLPPRAGGPHWPRLRRRSVAMGSMGSRRRRDSGRR